MVRKPRPRFGWSGETVSTWKWGDELETPMFPNLSEELKKDPVHHLRELDPAVLQWLLAEDELVLDRESLAEPQQIREEAMNSRDWNSRSFDVGGTLWKDHKPLQSPWVERALTALKTTRARSAVPAGFEIFADTMISVA